MLWRILGPLKDLWLKGRERRELGLLEAKHRLWGKTMRISVEALSFL